MCKIEFDQISEYLRANAKYSMVFVMALGLASCALESEKSDSSTDSLSQPVLGGVQYGSDCTETDKAFLDEVLLDARAAAVSTAFQQCMELALGTGASAYYGGTIGPYYGCNGDPASGRDIASQTRQAIDTARSANFLAINCTGGAGLASTSIGSWGHGGAETFWFSDWLHAVDASYSVGGVWPQAQAADVIWHEANHTQGYGHGDNGDNAAAANACGTTTIPGWHFQVNTIPYITGACIGDVLYRSGAMCTGASGPVWGKCGSTGHAVISSYPGTPGVCSCVSDSLARKTYSIHYQDDRGATADGDWAVGLAKGECEDYTSAQGISRAGDGGVSKLLCSSRGITPSWPANYNSVIDFTSSDSRFDTSTGDWDWGFIKGECASNGMIVGIAQEYDTGVVNKAVCNGYLGIKAVDCSRVDFNNHDAREAGYDDDWDWGALKGQCGDSRYVKGISKDASGHIKSLLCCSARYF